MAASSARTAVVYSSAKECMCYSNVLREDMRTNREIVDKHNPDITYYLSPVNYWPIIESALGLIGACLPLLRPIGHVYSLRNIYLVSSRALSRISWVNGSSKGSSRSLNRSHSSKEGSIPDDIQRDSESAKSNKWLKIYHNRYYYHKPSGCTH